MTDEPLIYTTKGNLRVDSLQHHVEWKVTPEQVIFSEIYTLAGEVVKQSTHVHVLTGVSILGDANS